jgi:outer membrane lipoprotein-sorting protein
VIKLLRSRIHFVFVLVLLISAGCSVAKTRVVLPQNQRLLPAKVAGDAELFQSLQEKSKQIETLKASVLLDVEHGGAKSGVLDRYRETKGIFVVDRPAHIRIQVQVPVVLSNLAILVSDENQYRVWSPLNNTFAVGDVNAPVIPNGTFTDLRPKIFLDGLFVDIRPYLNKPNMKYSVQQEVNDIHSYYVFTFFDVASESPQIQALEKIWIDRADLQVARKQVFGKDGGIETDAEYENYQTSNGIPFPQTITIQRPIEAFKIKMAFQMGTLKLNEKIDRAAFELTRPEGSELVQLTK